MSAQVVVYLGGCLPNGGSARGRGSACPGRGVSAGGVSARGGVYPRMQWGTQTPVKT